MMKMSGIGILSGALLLAALGGAAAGRDVTPPAGVTRLRSTSHDKGKDKWHSPQSKESIVKVSWVAAADNPGGTGVDGYSVAWDEAPETLPDTIKDIEQTETRAESPALADGKKHYFHIRAVDNAGNWARKAAHIGPFFIDTKRPGDVTGLRVTHGSVARRIVGVSWAAAKDERDGSGVDGYSILWDNAPKSLPDKTKDIEQTETKATSQPLAKGKVHYFHIRTVDNAGNWAKKAAHIGPLFFREDKIKPNNVRNLRTMTHPSAIGRWHKPQSRDNTVGLAWTPAKDNLGGSGVDGYAVVWNNAAATVPAPAKVFEQSVNGTTSPVLADGTRHYFHIRAVDRAGNWVAGAAHIGPFYIDTKPPGVVTNLRSPSHAGAVGKWDNPQSRDTTVEVAWTAATTLSNLEEAGSNDIKTEHVAEAIQYRTLDRDLRA